MTLPQGHLHLKKRRRRLQLVAHWKPERHGTWIAGFPNEMRNAELQAIRNLGAESYLIKPIESKGLDEALEMCDLL